MEKGTCDAGTAEEDDSLRTVAVLVGLALFVGGFLLLITSIAESQSDSSSVAAQNPPVGDTLSGRQSSVMSIVALSMSIAGLAIATVGPVEWLVRSSRRTH